MALIRECGRVVTSQTSRRLLPAGQLRVTARGWNGGRLVVCRTSRSMSEYWATAAEYYKCIIFPLKSTSSVLDCSPPPACCLLAPERGAACEQRGSSVSLKQWSCVQAGRLKGKMEMECAHTWVYKLWAKHIRNVWFLFFDHVCAWVGVLLKLVTGPLICRWSLPPPIFCSICVTSRPPLSYCFPSFQLFFFCLSVWFRFCGLSDLQMAASKKHPPPHTQTWTNHA